MTDYSELIEDLRINGLGYGFQVAGLTQRAAKALEAQAKEIEKLEEANVVWRVAFLTSKDRIAELEALLEVKDEEIQLLENRLRVALDAVKEDTARIAGLEADIAELREVLKETLAIAERNELGDYQLRARAALRGEKG